MKFIIIKSNLKNAVGIAERIETENLNLPILKNFLLEAEGNRIKITSTNLDIAVSCIVAGKVIEEGRCTAPSRLFSNIISNIPSDRLNIEEKKTKIEIKTDNYEATIQGIPADEFPPTPKIKDQSSFIEIKAVIFKEAAEQVLFSSQYSDLRPELNSMLFDFNVDAIKLTTTDSFRLSEKTITAQQFESNNTESFRVLVPLKTINYVIRAFEDEAIVRIYHDKNQIFFKTDKTEILSRLTEGDFPDYSALVPKKFTAEIVVKKDDFLNALKLAGVFSDKNNEVRLLIKEQERAVEVLSSSDSLGKNKYILSCKVKGSLPEIVFNWKYVADALKALRSEEVFLGINGEGNPAEIKSVGDGSYFYILKPIAGV